MSPLRITVLELAATWGEPDRVLDGIDARLAAGPATDLVLVPEASVQGYAGPGNDFDLTPHAQPIDGPIARRCAAIATGRGIHFVAPLVLREGRARFNAMACFAPDGTVAFVYRKRHPWIPERWATPGPTAPPVLALGGHRLTIGICYDVHFLPRDAAEQLQAADVLLFPSAWVEQPDTREAHLAQLAMAFDLHVINANWAPGVVKFPGQGGSCILGPNGETVARAAVEGRIDVALP